MCAKHAATQLAFIKGATSTIYSFRKYSNNIGLNIHNTASYCDTMQQIHVFLTQKYLNSANEPEHLLA